MPGECHGQRMLMGYSPWDHRESDTTEWLTHRSISPWSNPTQCWHWLTRPLQLNYFCVQNVKQDSWWSLFWQPPVLTMEYGQPPVLCYSPTESCSLISLPCSPVGFSDLLDQENAKEVSLWCHHQILWSQGFQSSLGALTFRTRLLKAELPWTEKPRAPEAASCRRRTTKSGPSPQSTCSHPLPAMWLHHSRWIGFKFGEVCYLAIGNWTHLTCRTSDYHVRSTVKIIQKHLVNHKVFQECKGSLLMSSWIALPVPAQRVTLGLCSMSWQFCDLALCLCSWIFQVSFITERCLRGCLPEAPDLHACTLTPAPWVPNNRMSFNVPLSTCCLQNQML